MEIGYSQWKDEHRSALEDFGDKRVFLLFSGGVDSSLSMELMLRASKEFGFRFEAHAGSYPLHRYTDKEKERIGGYWRQRGVPVIWHDMGVADDYIESAPNPCLSCQKVRKKMLNTILSESVDDWGRLVLVANYSLWDIVSYSIEHVLSNLFCDNGRASENDESMRFIETSQRFYPILRMNDGYTVFRPLLKYNRSDIIKSLQKEHIPTLSIPCKFANFRPKRILQMYYEEMGMRFDYHQVFEFAKKSLDLPDISSCASIGKEEYFKKIF